MLKVEDDNHSIADRNSGNFQSLYCEGCLHQGRGNTFLFPWAPPFPLAGERKSTKLMENFILNGRYGEIPQERSISRKL